MSNDTPKQQFPAPRRLRLDRVDAQVAYFTQVDGNGLLRIEFSRAEWEDRGAPLTIEAMLP